MATLTTEKILLNAGFHPLGQHPQAEAMSQANHCPGDGFITPGLGEALDEGFIDLQLVEWKEPNR